MYNDEELFQRLKIYCKWYGEKVSDEYLREFAQKMILENKNDKEIKSELGRKIRFLDVS